MPETKLIDGTALAEKIRGQVRQEIVKKKLEPQLAVILVGDNPASALYVSLKEKACAQAGIPFHKYLMAKDTSPEHLLEVIDFLNKDNHIDAILIQLPLPQGLDEDKIISAMDPAKDVDGFHPENLRKFYAGQPYIIPGLSAGILKLIEKTGEDLKGKKAVIVANSEIFAKPLIKTLKDQGAHAEFLSSADPTLKAHTRQADILIVAVGKPYFIDGDMIKPGSIIIDVGTNKEGNTVVGDVDIEEARGIASHISPVPGGVGPMTIAMLLKNVVKLHQIRR